MSARQHKAVVVGGGNGIGAAVVTDLKQRGVDVCVWDIDGERDITCDVSDPSSVAAAAAETVTDFGVPTEVTITAGIGHSGFLLDVTPDEWDRVMNVNSRGVWLAMRELARPMLAGDGGSIVVTTSVSARLADRMMGVYCASKAALDMLVAVAAAEWAPKVRVNGVAPGVTQTRMLGNARIDGGYLKGVVARTPLGRLGTADDVAETVRLLHGSRWTTGEVVRSDGGLLRHSPISPIGDYSV
ncbi:MAG: SDR family NAD(P)-dependent oxidoreductase [Acidimicrobiia bacterium]